MGQKVIIRFWGESGLSSASMEPSHHFLQILRTHRTLLMFKIVFGDSPLYPKQLSLFCLLWPISAWADRYGYISNFCIMIHELKNSSC